MSTTASTPEPAPEPPVERLALGVLMASFEGPTLSDDYAELLAQGLGGICLFGSNLGAAPIGQVRALTDAIRAAGPQAVISTDEEGGDVTRLHAQTGSPVLGAAALGAAGSLDLTRATGAAVAADLVAAGIDLDLGPIADVNSNPDNPVIGTRSFAAEPQHAADQVAAWVEGLQTAGVGACVKHFPGHGDTGEDSHLALPVLDAPLEVIGARELVPFEAAVKAGTAAVMTSHIVVPALDPELPGTLSAPVLALLRDRLGFEGVIVSDALDMAGASATRGIPAAAVLSLAAGADLLCIGPDKPASLIREIQDAILAAVADGRLTQERLADAVRRIAALPRAVDAPAGPGVLDESDQIAGAAAALIIEGELPDLTGARVVSVSTPANIAVGEVPWGLSPDVMVAPNDAVPDGPLVVQVRDAHRRPDVLAFLAAVTGPALVVEWGWPGPYDGPLPRILTRGYSRPGAAAVRALLGTAGWRG
jgi:beta-N-acetylhexosaminidase